MCSIICNGQRGYQVAIWQNVEKFSTLMCLGINE